MNNQFESIGDLWLSFSMETVEKSVVKVVNLKFKISEDNLIEISANKQDLSYKNVTRKLSRGHVDEQLYLNIEKGLKHVNEMGEYYLAQDYEMRMVNIISNINQVLDKENENVDHDLLQKTQKLQKNAQELVERNEPVYSNIWYYEHMIDQFASMVDPEAVKSMRSQLKKLRQMNSSGEVSAEKLIEFNNNLSKEVSRVFKDYEGIDRLMYAYSLACEHNLDQAEEMRSIIDRIMNDSIDDKIRKSFYERAFKLMQNIENQVEVKGYQINTGITVSPTI